MSHSKGPWIYDAESGEIHTKDRTGFWGPDHEPVVVATVEQLDGVNNGPLLAAAPELLEACEAMIEWDEREKDHAVDFYARVALCDAAFQKARAAIAKATGEAK
ncbi:hypothetical protein FK514_26100 [Klebsiella pneumoniae]|uniref:hypothetical protein n=1 Tax=Klebsiella pneumoniae TaxID=573 RepID=UPI00210884A9|nr:hypothetical protein [Klebsiella pneumoniae]MCQ4051751.1 hypothetical protein [Klebsiella pneumoniae]